MPRTTITKTSVPGLWSQTGSALTKAAADVANGNQVEASGKGLLIAWNSGASPYYITINSAPDPLTGREGDVTQQDLAADEIRVFHLIPAGWSVGGYYEIDCENAAIYLGFLQL
jgi:hypothetical protein